MFACHAEAEQGRVTGHLSPVIFMTEGKKRWMKSAAIVSEIRLLWGAQAASLLVSAASRNGLLSVRLCFHQITNNREQITLASARSSERRPRRAGRFA
jgi:hypothetical protein